MVVEQQISERKAQPLSEFLFSLRGNGARQQSYFKLFVGYQLCQFLIKVRLMVVSQQMPIYVYRLVALPHNGVNRCFIALIVRIVRTMLQRFGKNGGGFQCHFHRRVSLNFLEHFANDTHSQRLNGVSVALCHQPIVVGQLLYAPFGYEIENGKSSTMVENKHGSAQHRCLSA